MNQETGNILVVDDNAANRNLLSRRLQWEGHAVSIAVDGLDALKRMEEQAFDLILLDIMMPGMNGYEVLEHMKNDDQLRHVPVIMISALDNIDSVVKCVQLGAEDYLFKPFNPLLLRARISASLEKKRLRDQEQAFTLELAMMQNIDRALNDQLDVQRALAITLDWALRRSNCENGIIALVNNLEIGMVVSQGFTQIFTETQAQNLLGFQEAINMQEPQAYHASIAPIEVFVEREAINQVVIPITRQGEVIGVFMVEKYAPPLINDKDIAFLIRLSDHAAMAISNAILYEQVQEANRAKSDFVSLVSHELKIPMTAIRGYADLLIGEVAGTINEGQERFLQTIRSNVGRMNTLVSDLTDISRIEAGRLRLDTELLDFNVIVEEVLRSTSSQIEAKNQNLIFDLPNDLPPILADSNRLIQVMINLVSNAYKYTPNEGNIEISASVIPHKQGTAERQFDVLVSVKDDGEGMSSDDQAKLFSKFFRSDNPNVRQESGTGLGLSITKHLIELQGGKIWCESEIGVGTTFYFTVPIAEEPARANEFIAEMV
jgi:signal transduction histidine kinase